MFNANHLIFMGYGISTLISHLPANPRHQLIMRLSRKFIVGGNRTHHSNCSISWDSGLEVVPYQIT